MTLAAVRHPPFDTAGEHLLAELRRLELELARQVERRRAAGRLAGDPAYRGLYVPDELVDALLIPAGAASPPGQHDRGIAQMRAVVARRVAVTPDGVLRLPGLVDAFGLDRLDLDALLLAVAPELDQRYATILSWLQDDATLRRPSVGLVADLWADPSAVRRRVDPAAPLLAGGLVDLVAPTGTVPASLLDHALVAAGRVVDFLLGDDRVAVGLRRCLTRYDTAPVPLADLAAPERVCEDLREAAACGGVVVLTGPPGCGRRTAATALAAARGAPVLVLDPVLRPAGVEPLELLDLVRREALLAGATLVVLDADTLAADAGERAVAGSLATSGTAVVLTGGRRWYHGIDQARRWLDVPMAEPGFAERRRLWQRALTDLPASSLTAVADAFLLGPGQIAAAAAAAARGGTPDDAALAAAARAQSASNLERFARRVRTPHTWSDLVVPARVRRHLDELVAAARHRATVHGEWGFAERRGLHVLFCGPSGTGKTMSAALVAGELGLDLYAVNIAATVSKYIGETEKNLDEVFEQGRASNAILVFDEADALFGRRSEVKDAHDRYANLEVAFLLQRIEQFDGITILTTNLRANLDVAFARRLQHVVEFPAPDARLRARIWRVALPAAVPLADDVDLEFLAGRVELTGAGIRNAALAAAYLAAAAGTAVGMTHLVRGVGRELQKTGRVASRAAFGDFYELFLDGP